MKQLIEAFKNKYAKGVEVEVPRPVITIRDNFPSPFSSGTNGYIDKLRINKDTNEFEYHHDWWSGGWSTDKEYISQAEVALLQVI